MTKKILAILLSFVLLFSFFTVAYAKKETKKETVKETTKEEAKPAVKKVVEPKDPLKEKTSIAVDVFNSTASMRIWASDKMGFDFSVGLGFRSNPSSFGLNLGAGLVFPMIETEKLMAYVVPGLQIDVQTITVTVGTSETQTAFSFLTGAGFEFEGFIVSQVLSIGSSIGIFLGIEKIGDDTSFIFDVARNIAIKPLIVRFYF